MDSFMNNLFLKCPQIECTWCLCCSTCFKQTSKLHYSLDLGLMRLVMAFCMLQECIVTNNSYKLSTNPINSWFWTWIIAIIIQPLQEVAPHGDHFLEPWFAPNVNGAAKISRYWPCIFDQVFGCQKIRITSILSLSNYFLFVRSENCITFI
jgi:hypothetical protein